MLNPELCTLQGLHNKLYVVLTTEMHKALNQLREQGGEPAPAAEGAQMAEAAPSSALLSTEKLKQLQGLADEAELNGDARAAVGYHEQRVMGSTSAQVGCQQASLCHAVPLLASHCLVCTWQVHLPLSALRHTAPVTALSVDFSHTLTNKTTIAAPAGLVRVCSLQHAYLQPGSR